MVKRKFEEFIQNEDNNELYNKIKKIENDNSSIDSINIKNGVILENIEFDSHFFDEASKAWNENKIKKKDCTYQYKCTYRNQKKVRCNCVLYEYELLSKKKPLKMNCDIFCKKHINKKYNPKIHTFC